MTGQQGFGDLVGQGLIQVRSSEFVALGFPAFETCDYPGPDHGPFELAEDAQYLEEGTSSRGGCVQGLLVQVQVHACGLDLREEAYEVLEGPAQTVNRPCCDEIELTSCRSLEEAVEGWALIASLGTTDTLVLEHLHDGPTGSLSDSLKVGKLVLDRLLIRRDPGVDGNAFCHGPRMLPGP